MAELSLSSRVRSTPFTNRVSEAGVKGYTVYNHMALPTVFRSLEEDYRHLKTSVQVWDVSCERQVELKGPDAGLLAQMMTPRDLSRQKIGQTIYTPICDDRGHVLNDPVTIKLQDDRYWVSIADSDVGLFAKGLAIGAKLNVEVFEPDVHPLGVQGPKADELIARVFGDEMRQTPFFGTQTREFGGRTHLIARSGYSGQGGFEIYLSGSNLGEPLWDALMEAGRDLDVRAGCPNVIERVESGLLSFGNDMTSENTIAETGLHRFCKTIAPDHVGANAIKTEGEPKRQIRFLKFEGGPMSVPTKPVSLFSGNAHAGRVTTAIWSPDHKTNVAIGMIEAPFWDAGSKVTLPDGREGIVQAGPAARQ